MKQIKINGMNVSCYGYINENSNIFIGGTWNNGGGDFEEWYEGSFKTWQECVKDVTEWALKVGCTIDQIECD